MYNNPAETYSIEMIVVDEEGTTMQANVLKRWFSLFEHLLKDTGCYFIVKLTIGRNNSRNKYVANDNKIGIYSDSKVYLCSDFSGPTYGFSFTTFDPIVAQSIPEDTPLDVIGFVADVGEVKNIKTSKGKDTYKVNVLIQDLKMHKIFLSLWGSYADEILDVWANKEKSGLIILRKSLALKIVCFRILVFRHVQPTHQISRERFYLILRNTLLTLSSITADVNLSKVKQVVIVATVELIPTYTPWYYMSCKTCNRKLTTVNHGPDISGTELVDQEVIYQCKTVGCNPTAVPGSQRLKIPLTKHLSLEKKANNYEPGNSESISNTLIEIPSQETVLLKASLESTDDNVTPSSITEQAGGKKQVGKEATFKSKSKNPDFKRKLVDAYDIEDTGALSATKAISDGKKTLLVPKVDATNFTYYRIYAKMMRKKRKQYLDARKAKLTVISNNEGLNNIHSTLQTSPNYGTGGYITKILNPYQSISYQQTNVTYSDVHIRSPLSDISNVSPTYNNTVEASSSNNSDIQHLQFTKEDHQHDGQIITYNATGKSKGLVLNEDQIKHLTLFEIKKFLLRNNSTLRRYPTMPFPDDDCISLANNTLLNEELAYDKKNLRRRFS
ncbi:hypothetical protein L1987_86199 [Smallanthus sonchifolius]|uniref:Uncharacterized protein n=1 Tax=Smallanthus sonchifolius TaxID=185202 RepID=A0ACB8XZC6_9ASTR|nr:hypothetical protein L1987_86199 [Smallanthus sonchifolius]